MACDMCGRDDEDLTAVHRVYTVPTVSRLEEVERWCPSCCSQYPHEPVAQ